MRAGYVHYDYGENMTDECTEYIGHISYSPGGAKVTKYELAYDYYNREKRRVFHENPGCGPYGVLRIMQREVTEDPAKTRAWVHTPVPFYDLPPEEPQDSAPTVSQQGPSTDTDQEEVSSPEAF